MKPTENEMAAQIFEGAAGKGKGVDDKYILLATRHFNPLLLKNCPADVLASAVKLRDTLSFDEYAGYSPDEHRIYTELKTLVASWSVSYESNPKLLI